MTTASKITLVRVVLIPVYMVLMLLSANGADWLRWAAVAVFVIASISDFLDGYIARHYNQVSDFGKFLDPLADKLMVFGEVGLGGEVRAASHVRERVKEGARLGFERCIIPKQSFSSLSRSENYGIQIIGVRTLEQAFRAINADKEKENKE